MIQRLRVTVMEKEGLFLFSVLFYYSQVVSAILQLKIAPNPKGSRTQHFWNWEWFVLSMLFLNWAKCLGHLFWSCMLKLRSQGKVTKMGNSEQNLSTLQPSNCLCHFTLKQKHLWRKRNPKSQHHKRQITFIGEYKEKANLYRGSSGVYM